jgi:hypothetical protein
MARRINIESLVQAKKALDPEAFNAFSKHYGVEIKDYEIEDLRGLTEGLRGSGCKISDLNGFYVGYKIPQVGKEFDLLRFGLKNIINIELKGEASVEKIKKQLIRNKYYLNFIGREVCAFTFVLKSKHLYFLNDDEELEKSTLTELAALINQQALDEINEPDFLFHPSDFLVSPFNSTDKFLAGEYFLTHQQEHIKNEIITTIDVSIESNFISISGGAGTGKTLLTYDIARAHKECNKKPLIIHCGALNKGHELLMERGWEITSIRDYAKYDLANYDLVIVDEAQRIYPAQLDAITKKITLLKRTCIFSHDKLQTLSRYERASDQSTKILAIESITKFKLSEKIRTNKEIASFIKMLFNKKESVALLSKGNIEVNYFNDSSDAKDYLDALDEVEWTVLRFTPSLYDKEHHEEYSNDSSRTSHKIIGQEFNSVAVAIDKFFSYAENGDLIYKSRAYYDLPKMLFQNITRARQKLNVVIIDNQELLNRCIAILQ